MTGLDRPSSNSKTGPMLQTWVLVDGIHPQEAIKTKQDISVCGACPHRGTTCYVLPFQGPTAVYKAYAAGNYQEANLKKLGRNQRIRITAYGDAAAVPIHIWDDLLLYSSGHTGYTNSPLLAPELKRYLMASASTPEQAQLLQNLGWKTFRTKTSAQPQLPGELKCPFTKEGTLKCISCLKCDGKQNNIVVNIHGSPHKIKTFTKRHQDEQTNKLELLEPISI